MMNYDSKKTLSENVEVIEEQNRADGAWIGTKVLSPESKVNPIEKDAISMKGQLEHSNTNESEVVRIIKKYKNSSDFVNFIKEYNKIGNEKFNIALRKAINSSRDANELKEIQDHLKKININATEEIDKNGAAIIKFQYITKNPKTTPDETKPQITPPQIPSELKDSEGVKKFQDWLDQNKKGWATGYPEGVLNKQKGYGRFGPRTQKAWNQYKDEYLNQPSTDGSDTQQPNVVVTNPEQQTKSDEYKQKFVQMQKDSESLKQPLSKFSDNNTTQTTQSEPTSSPTLDDLFN